MLPVKTKFYYKILMMAATKYGHQPAQRLGWAALAYHKQEHATPDLVWGEGRGLEYREYEWERYRGV